MKLLFVGRKFGGVAGGVERMAIMLMNAMCKRDHEVSLLTWDTTNAESFYPIDPSICWHQLDMGDPMLKADWSLRFKRMRWIRSMVHKERPDVIIVFQQGPFMTISLSLLGKKIPIIAAVRNSPARFQYTRAGKYRDWLYETYRLASKVTVQMESYKDHYPHYLQSRLETIPNPVLSAFKIANPVGSPGSCKILLNIGRITYQKNQTTLLRAFAQIVDDYPEWKLRFIGEGDEQDKLRQLALQLGITGSVEIIGPIRDVDAEYAKSHLFCLPSIWEGFPNALAEAMAHGLPVVGFQSCEGTNELIEPGINGELVEGNFDDKALAMVLKKLMSDDAKRGELGQQARKISEIYSPELIFSQWERLFEELCR